MISEVLLISSLSGISTMIGITIAYWLVNFVKNFYIKKILEASAIGFSAGIMIILSLVELLWRPLQMADIYKVILWFTMGIFSIWLLDILLPHFHFFKKESKEHKYLLKIGLLIAIGFILHDFPEGMSIAGTYSFSKNWGLLVGLAVALHNIPEEFAMSLPIVMLKRIKLLIIIGLFSAFSEPFGAIIGLSIIGNNAEFIPYFASFAGGAMIYIAFSELVPFGLKIKSCNYFYFGVGIGMLSYFLLSLIL